MGDLVPLTKYGERFKLERKLMNQALGLSAVEKWQPIVAKETHLLLSHLVQSPEGYLDSFKRWVLSVVHGVQTALKETLADSPGP